MFANGVLLRLLQCLNLSGNYIYNYINVFAYIIWLNKIGKTLHQTSYLWFFLICLCCHVKFKIVTIGNKYVDVTSSLQTLTY